MMLIATARELRPQIKSMLLMFVFCLYTFKNTKPVYFRRYMVKRIQREALLVLLIYSVKTISPYGHIKFDHRNLFVQHPSLVEQ
jgi:hypothetical protein